MDGWLVVVGIGSWEMIRFGKTLILDLSFFFVRRLVSAESIIVIFVLSPFVLQLSLRKTLNIALVVPKLQKS
jgi:hypothetical protein